LKTVGNFVGNVTSKVVDGVEKTAENIYQGSKDVVDDIENVADFTTDDINNYENIFLVRTKER